MERYNIAFVPKFKSNEFIALATEIIDKPFSYILGNKSIPHVTICQFYSEEHKLGDLSKKICFESSDFNLHLSFREISHTSFKKPVYWVSLLPENTLKLHEVFNYISKLVNPLRTDDYDPHLTLFNYAYINQKNEINLEKKINDKVSIQDEFELIIGTSDCFGQLTRIIKILT
ncbi:hypothetical protein [Legionella worsleiensis]|uniref:2',5' RNA ligase family n=1 Tax=Legionella worsleiensis TaxID=45076 RepID=A0A0W1AJ76_9GAMM|nr:hypothetical protein [Legionella worsleiensis]KTD81405.1 hypothetical protein Lwor_0682 [Legionella worsleiensis]STY30070.1 Uncharacterised protein [Legionella worsleiensis]